MTKRRTKPTRVTADITHMEIMPDASGAPAVVRYNGYTFAFDFLGELRCRLLGPLSGARADNKIAREICERTYLGALHTQTDDAWFVRNREWYLEAAV
jgi:hypothetical protein